MKTVYSLWTPLAALALLAGCQTYEPFSLDLSRHEAAWNARRSVAAPPQAPPPPAVRAILIILSNPRDALMAVHGLAV